jgi:SAM-dependent methyltransferase
MKFKRSQEEQLILSYLQNIKLERCSSINVFWDNLYRKYDKDIIDRLYKLVIARADNNPNGAELYTVKNQNLELSIDFTRFSTDLYRKYFEWLTKRKDLEPRKILDLGCDNGIVTCFYAALFPHAEVIGVDVNEAAISCSNRLKDQLKLENVQFKQLNINEIRKHFANEHYDIISSIRTLHEVINISQLRCWSLYELGTANIEPNELLNDISLLLNPHSGEFISWERLANTPELAWWTFTINKSGMSTNLLKSCKLEFSEVGDTQIMPLLVSRVDAAPILTATDILKFAAGGDSIDFEKKTEYLDDSAELAFNNCADKKILFGFQANYAKNSGNDRLEVWETEKQLLEYVYSNFGYRKLIIHSKSSALVLKNNLLKSMNEIVSGGTKTCYYESIEERDGHRLNK